MTLDAIQDGGTSLIGISAKGDRKPIRASYKKTPFTSKEFKKSVPK